MLRCSSLILTALVAGTLAGFGPADVRGQVSGGKLPTQWDEDVSPTNPLPEYPRPQMVRTLWQSLNGPWDYVLTDAKVTSPPTAFNAGKMLVPFPYESSLSGVGKPSPTGQRLWYRRTFAVPDAWRTGGQRVLLHFGAVNWYSAVFINGKEMGQHKGGFDGFDYDITDKMKPGDNTLIVSAWNPMLIDSPDAQVVGKQRAHRGGIFYTGSTGIWQSVWLEPVPDVHIDSLKIVTDLDNQQVTIFASGNLPSTTGPPRVPIIISDDDGKEVARGFAFDPIKIPNPKLWTPDSPHLYTVQIAVSTEPFQIDDPITGYFAMRKISLGKDDQGRAQILLNDKFVFEIGALDQGYWPDGIYTAPTDDALKSDIVAAEVLGLNLLRKHAKVEPERWYFWADKLGMLVWQDMPQCFDSKGPKGERILSDAAKAQWLVEWKQILAQRINHPCIIVWTTFNEGWGQHDTENIVALTKQIDPSRLVNDASGWTDKGVGDISDAHAYPGPGCETAGETRASVNGEFGGLTMRVPGHMWTTALYGYGTTLKTGWKVTQKYQQLLKTAYALRDQRGCSAFVYTQLTDVEDESNGLLTYDRAVVKPFSEIIAAANNGHFLPLPPSPASKEFLPTSEEDAQTWSFVTQKPAKDWAQPAFDASSWKTGPAPFGQGYVVNTPWTDTPGDIWLRRTVTLPKTIPAKLVVRTIHDDDAEAYVNGVLAASAPGYVSDYADLPMSDAARAALKSGENVIAVHCHQNAGAQVIDVGIAEAK